MSDVDAILSINSMYIENVFVDFDTNVKFIYTTLRKKLN